MGLDELASFLIFLEMNLRQTSQHPTPNFFEVCDAMPQILQLGTDGEAITVDAEGAAAAFKALVKIVDESSFAPGLRCSENGPSETADGTRDEDGADVDDRLFPLLAPDDANGLESSREVVN